MTAVATQNRTTTDNRVAAEVDRAQRVDELRGAPLRSDERNSVYAAQAELVRGELPKVGGAITAAQGRLASSTQKVDTGDVSLKSSSRAGMSSGEAAQLGADAAEQAVREALPEHAGNEAVMGRIVSLARDEGARLAKGVAAQHEQHQESKEKQGQSAPQAQQARELQEQQERQTAVKSGAVLGAKQEIPLGEAPLAHGQPFRLAGTNRDTTIANPANNNVSNAELIAGVLARMEAARATQTGPEQRQAQAINTTAPTTDDRLSFFNSNAPFVSAGHVTRIPLQPLSEAA